MKEVEIDREKREREEVREVREGEKGGQTETETQQELQARMDPIRPVMGITIMIFLQ